MTVVLDPDDPLHEASAGLDQRPGERRIPPSEGPFTKVERSEILTRRMDRVFPPLTRLYLYVRIRTGGGRYPFSLTNNAALDIGLSRWQKYKLLRQLEDAGFVEVTRVSGEAPKVSLCPLTR